MSGSVVISPESAFDPRVQISAEAYAHILAIKLTQSHLRVSIFGFAEVIRKGNIFLYNRIALPEQVATFRESVMVPSDFPGLMMFYHECRWRGISPERLDGFLIMSPVKKKHIWPPNPDEPDIPPCGSKEFMLTVVCNQKEELAAKLEIFNPRQIFLDIPVEILKEPAFMVPLQMHTDAQDKVRKRKRIRKKGGKAQ